MNQKNKIISVTKDEQIFQGVIFKNFITHNIYY